MQRKDLQKLIFIAFPLIVFILLILGGYHIQDNYLQNLIFCISGALLGIIATFLVIDSYYKRNEIIENSKLLFNLVQSFNQLILNIYFSIIASYVIENYENNKEIFGNKDLMVSEIDRLISIVKTYPMNDYSKYRYNDKTKVQLEITKKNLNEIKDIFLYLPKTLDIYKKCFPILLDAIKYFQYFELRIVNNNTMLDVDISNIALNFLNDFNKNFIQEVKNLDNEDLNKIIFR